MDNQDEHVRDSPASPVGEPMSGTNSLRQAKAPRVMLTVEAAAEQLSISRTRMYQLLKAGEIESIKVGRLRRIPAASLTSYVRQLIAAQHAA